MLIGSLSNDLLRVANLSYRGSNRAAERFLKEAQHWAVKLEEYQLEDYLKKIVDEVLNLSEKKLNQKKAESLLMQSILLQNYSLKIK